MCRDLVKQKNAYVILQKHHLWESDPAARYSNERLVDLLIVEDPLPSNCSAVEAIMTLLNSPHVAGDLRSVEIPETMKKKVSEGYNEAMKEIDEETKKLHIDS